MPSPKSDTLNNLTNNILTSDDDVVEHVAIVEKEVDNNSVSAKKLSTEKPTLHAEPKFELPLDSESDDDSFSDRDLENVITIEKSMTQETVIEHDFTMEDEMIIEHDIVDEIEEVERLTNTQEVNAQQVDAKEADTQEDNSQDEADRDNANEKTVEQNNAEETVEQESADQQVTEKEETEQEAVVYTEEAVVDKKDTEQQQVTEKEEEEMVIESNENNNQEEEEGKKDSDEIVQGMRQDMHKNVEPSTAKNTKKRKLNSKKQNQEKAQPKKASVAQQESEEEEEEEEEYEVEKIMAHKSYKGQVVKYLIKWKGYDDKDNTMEAASRMHDDVYELCRTYWDTHPELQRPMNAPPPLNKQVKTEQQEETVTSDDDEPPRKKTKSDRPIPPKYMLDKGFKYNKSWPTSKTNWKKEMSRFHAVQVSPEDRNSILAYIEWKNGQKTIHELPECHKNCPEALIHYYEERLKFV